MSDKVEVIDEYNYESMFNEIERICEVFHSIKINDNDLRKLLEEKHLVCMCGGLIFTKLLPDDIAKKYHEWANKRFLNRLDDKHVDDLSHEIDKIILKDIKENANGKE